MINRIRGHVLKFLESSKEFPIITALAAGLYPFLYYYNANFTLINSWSQLLFFIICFLLIPVVGFFIIDSISKRIEKLKPFSKYIKYLLPILNFTVFAFLIVISTYGFKKKILVLAISIALILGILLHKHLKKVIVLQFLMSALVFAKLIPDIQRQITYSSDWMIQSDNIEAVKFENTPNIYVIQPDGYANFSELKKENYNFNNSEFESFLSANDFTLYNNFRSNYFSTLSSNSSMFAMKHHYFNKPKFGINEVLNSRQVIIGDNPVVSIFKNNNYKTFLMLEKSYLLVNRAEIKYDFCNVDYSEVPYLSRGFDIDKDIIKDLKLTIENNSETNNFYFIEKIGPGHISTYKSTSEGVNIERLKYLQQLKYTNDWLEEIIDLIQEKDKDALIIMIADHGGFVGMNYTLECKEKQENEDIIRSIFTSALAIKWPGEAPEFDGELKTGVNLFRVLFSYLSEDESYLNELQEDSSFTIIEKGAPYGVYEYIDNNGNIVFNKFSN